MQLKSIDIGKYKTKNNVFLAPLAGYTNAPFRELCSSLGAGLTFSEMVSAKGLCFGSEKTAELLALQNNTDIHSAQIFGSSPDCFKKALEHPALQPFQIIDINMGCPVPKIYKNGEGSALLNNLHLASELIRTVKDSGKATTVKFRIGVNNENLVTRDFAKMCEDSGADLITIHGRVRSAYYTGEVNFDEIAKAKNAVSIPVIANGGVNSKESADEIMQKTGADGVMLARAVLYRPWLFCDILGEKVPSKKNLILKQIERTRELFDEHFTIVHMRKMVAFYLKGVPNSATQKVQLFEMTDIQNVIEVVNEYFD